MANAANECLSSSEVERLSSLEATIDRGLKNFVVKPGNSKSGRIP